MLLWAACAGSAWAQQWPSLAQPAPVSADGGQDAAVIIGVEDYVFVPGVPGARANAEDWYAHLTGPYGVPAEHVVLLRDSEATLEGMRKHLAAAASQIGDGGRLWVVFVGHGAPAADGQDGVLVGADAQQNPDSLYARSLPLAELRRLSDDAVLILDACFSGRGADGQPLVSGLQPLIPAQAAAGPQTVLSAAQADQFAGPLPGADRPAYSYLLLGAMRGWGDRDGDGQVTAAEASAYAERALQMLARDRSQRPQHTGDPGLVLASGGKEAGPDLATQVLAQRPAAGAVAAPAPEPAVAEQEAPGSALYLGVSRSGLVVLEHHLGPRLAAQVGLGLGPYSDSLQDTWSVALSGSVGLRQYASKARSGWFWGGYVGAYRGEICETLTDGDCTTSTTYTYVPLGAYGGRRLALGEQWALAARLGPAFVLYEGFGPDVELSVGYAF